MLPAKGKNRSIDLLLTGWQNSQMSVNMHYRTEFREAQNTDKPAAHQPGGDPLPRGLPSGR